MDYTLQWARLMKSERRISRSLIKANKLYRISVYNDGNPNYHRRYIFVIGYNRRDKKIDCIKLNNIEPMHFIEFLNKIRNKKIKIRYQIPIDKMITKFPSNGKQLFENHIKTNKLIYAKNIDSYRVYKIQNINYVMDLSFEDDVFIKLFSDSKTVSNQRNVVKEEIAEDND